MTDYYGKHAVYISGPITGREHQEVMDHFSKMHNILEKKGFDVYNPTLNPKRGTWEDYMRDGIVQLMKCDSIMMLQGWSKSKGATLEKYIAEQLGMSIHYEDSLDDPTYDQG